MAETLSTRFGLTVWGAGTDGPSRAEFNGWSTALEAYAAIDTQGTLAARPVAGQAQRYYYATDTGVLYRDNGSAWTVVGAALVDAVAAGSTTGAVPLTVDALVGQTADLLQAKVNGSQKFGVTKDGNVSATGTVVGAGAAFTTTDAAVRALLAKGAAAQTADLIAAQNSAGTDQFTVGPAGVIGGTYLQVGAGKALLGASGYITTANQTLFNGITPAAEVRSTTGGTGTYTDMLAIRHPQFDGTAVTRRLGIQIKLGDEISGDAGKAGGMYVESTAASAADPSLVLFRGDAAVMTFASTGIAALVGGMSMTSTLDINKTGAPSQRFNTNVAQGAQGSSIYQRVAAANSFYWYVAGSHSDTPGDAGGGSTAASLSSAGLLTAARYIATSTAAASLAQASPALMVGASGSANLIADTAGLQARNNSAAATMVLNGAGGDITLGAASGSVNVPGTFKIGGLKVTISATEPSSPSLNDIWIDV